VSETAKQWGHTEAYVVKLCATGRVKRTMSVPTFEAFGHAPPGLRFVWLIPADVSKSHTYYTRLTEAQREEIVRRARDGEGRTALARGTA
jgi:hypothetical protein